VTGGVTKEVDHSRCIVVFAMPVYFQKISCVKELTRTIVCATSISRCYCPMPRCMASLRRR